MHVRSLVVTLLLLGDCLARPENLVDEIEDLYAGFDALASDDITESNKENLESYDWKQDDSTTFYNDPEIREIAEREYENAMGRIIAVNLAHWRKRQQEGTEQSQQDKREYHENVQEKIETVNQANGFFFYQGDVILDCELYEELHPGKSCRGEEQTETRKKRNALRSRKRLWTSRVIPYMVPSFMSHIRSNLMKAISKIQGSTCLRFVRYNGHKNYITFDASRGCSSRVGKRYAEAGRQTISLGDGCNFESTITHELLHALGFFHEQAREDRNKFVEIKWENILDGFSDQFDRYAFNTLDNVGKDYDFQSVMHYDRKAFTKNGLDTIIRLDRPNENFGMPGGKALSPQDIAELNALYDCRTRNYGWTQWSRFTPCDDNCMKERQRYCYHSGNPKSCGGNVNAYGIETVKVKCGKYECPAKVDGHWGRWSEWTNCDARCDDGKRKRYRICDNPVPKHGGKYCPGNSKEEGLCTLRRCTLGYDDTDFDSKILGMWKNAGQIQWRRNKYFTKTKDTGPNGDHTTGKGYYLYMESSAPARAGGRAVLESPWLKAPRGGQCMKFFYTMFGKTMGSLFVVLQQRGKGRPVTIFAKNRNQGIYWIGAKVNLDIPEGVNYKIKIFAQIGRPGYSDIAIDDVYFDPGLCFCQDDYVSCPKWKAKGYCTKDVNFMSKHCARSCDTCECKDDNANCPGWAAQPNGCEKNRAYMRGNCKKSCKVCHPPKGQTISAPANKRPKVCKDTDETQCPIWAKIGECKKNPWMNQGCPLSCGKCVCKDNHARCAEWAKIGECYRNKSWMQDNCAKSCRVCGARS